MTRRLAGPRLVVATHNRGKLEEIADLLAPYPVELVSAAELGLPEPAETAGSFLGNARIKAHAAAAASGLPALADDFGHRGRRARRRAGRAHRRLGRDARRAATSCTR